MDDVILKLYQLTAGNENFDQIVFRSGEVDLQFKLSDQSVSDLKDLLESLSFKIELAGRILTSSLHSTDQSTKIFPTYESLSKAVYDDITIMESTSLIVINKEVGFYSYDTNSSSEYEVNGGVVSASFLASNLRLYLPLLRMFRENRLLSEHDDMVNKELLIIDNGKNRDLVRAKYTIFEKRILSKRVEFDLNAISTRLSTNLHFTFADWIGIFKHNVVALLSAQLNENKTFTELFLNMPFVLANTTRDYEIFVSGFSFERVKSQLKEEKDVYFQTLNQAQEKVKSQVIAVPLSIGTSVYAFFQMDEEIRTFYFVLMMVGIYIGFICWYLILYDRDLKKLRKDIKADSEQFNSQFPKVYEIFKDDFDFILKKVKAVLTLSLVIKLVMVLSWIILLLFVLVVVKHPIQNTPFKFAI